MSNNGDGMRLVTPTQFGGSVGTPPGEGVPPTPVYTACQHERSRILIFKGGI